MSIGETGLHKAKALLRIGLYLVRAANNGLKKGPFHCYEHWLEIEKKSDARSTFFFWPGWSNVTQHHHTDCLYELHDRVVFDVRTVWSAK